MLLLIVPVPPTKLTSYLQDNSKSNQEKALIENVKSAVLRRLKAAGIDIYDNIVGQSVRYYTCHHHHHHHHHHITRSNYDWSDQFGTYRGSVFGLTHELLQLAVFRPRIKHPKYHYTTTISAIIITNIKLLLLSS